MTCLLPRSPLFSLPTLWYIWVERVGFNQNFFLLRLPASFFSLCYSSPLGSKLFITICVSLLLSLAVWYSQSMIQQILSVRIDHATPTDIEQPWSLGLDGSYVQSVCLSPAPSVMDSSMVSCLRPYPPLYVQAQWHRKFPCTWFSFATTMATSTITSLTIKFDCFLSLDNIVVYCCIGCIIVSSCHE